MLSFEFKNSSGESQLNDRLDIKTMQLWNIANKICMSKKFSVRLLVSNWPHCFNLQESHNSRTLHKLVKWFWAQLDLNMWVLHSVNANNNQIVHKCKKQSNSQLNQRIVAELALLRIFIQVRATQALLKKTLKSS